MNYLLFSWLRICIQSRWEEEIDNALNFAIGQGRMKYVRPIFRYFKKNTNINEYIN